MRPVTKGGVPNTYPNNIRLDTLNNLFNDANQLPTWNFRAASVNNAIGTLNPTRWLLLLAEYCLATLAVPANSGWTLPNLNAASGTITNRLATDQRGYQTAGPPLGVALGKFCSYCEQFLPGQIAVEHCAPKSPFPLFTLCWDNFLLACDACNGPTGKGQSPSRATATGWAPPNSDDCVINQAIRQHYLWPDTNPLAYRNLLPALTVWNNNQWAALPLLDSVTPGMVITGLDLPTRTITATIHYQGNWYQNQRVACWLASADQQAQDSIPYYGLDRDGTGTGKIADCRMYNRTIAWFKAVRFLVPIFGNLNTAQYVWPLLLLAAPSVGFFSVWVRVLFLMGFAQVAVPDSNPQVTFMQDFLNNMLLPSGFPGTNIAYVP